MKTWKENNLLREAARNKEYIFTIASSTNIYGRDDKFYETVNASSDREVLEIAFKMLFTRHYKVEGLDEAWDKLCNTIPENKVTRMLDWMSDTKTIREFLRDAAEDSPAIVRINRKDSPRAIFSVRYR